MIETLVTILQKYGLELNTNKTNNSQQLTLVYFREARKNKKPKENERKHNKKKRNKRTKREHGKREETWN